MKHPALQVEITLLTTEQGGRLTPVVFGNWSYRPVAVLGIHSSAPTYPATQAEAEARGVYGVCLKAGPDPIPLGSTVSAQLVVPMYEPAVQRLLEEGRFTLLEGTRVVAHGRVLGPVDDAV